MHQRVWEILCSELGFSFVSAGSVCAVAEVAITTKTEADDVSTTYTLNHGGDVTAAKPSHLGQGAHGGSVDSAAVPKSSDYAD